MEIVEEAKAQQRTETKGSYFRVVQYVPDPIADERVNVGVLVFGDGKVRARFVGNWSRVIHFGRQKDISFLQEAAAALAAASEEEIRTSAESWPSVIQMSDARGSLLDPDALLSEMADRFLKAEPVAVRAARTHQQAASATRKRVKDLYSAKFGREVASLVRPNLTALGRNAEHNLDIGIGNGVLICGMFALSFEVERALEREIKATAFSAEDLRDGNPNLPLAVAALPPRDDTRELFFFARDLFPKYGVPLLVESEIDAWAENIAPSIGTTTSH